MGNFDKEKKSWSFKNRPWKSKNNDNKNNEVENEQNQNNNESSKFEESSFQDSSQNNTRNEATTSEVNSFESNSSVDTKPEEVNNDYQSFNSSTTEDNSFTNLYSDDNSNETQSNDYSSNTETQSNDYSSNTDTQSNDYSSNTETQSNDYSNNETQSNETQSNDYSSNTDTQSNDYSSNNETQSNDYSNTETQSNDYSSNNETQSNDYTSSTETQSNDYSNTETQSNDYSSNNETQSNDYSNTETQSNDYSNPEPQSTENIVEETPSFENSTTQQEDVINDEKPELDKISEENYKEKTDFFAEDRISADKVEDEVFGKPKEQETTLPVDRDPLSKNIERPSFAIETKKYKLWSLKNMSKSNLFLPIVMPLIHEELEVPIDIEHKSNDELKKLLEFKFTTLFKEYIRDSKVCKLKLESKFEEIIRKLEKVYQDHKTAAENDDIEKMNVLKEATDAFDSELKVLNERLEELGTSVQTDIDLSKQKKGLLLLSGDSDDQSIEDQKIANEANKKDISALDIQVQEINSKIDEIVLKKNKVVEKMNKEKLEFINVLDGKFIQKEKDKTQLEVDKIEVLIFLRENLVALNRIIRNIKIQIGINNIQHNNENTGKVFDDIAKTLERTKKQFELLDSINKTNNKISVEQTIDASTRIVDLKTGEAF